MNHFAYSLHSRICMLSSELLIAMVVYGSRHVMPTYPSIVSITVAGQRNTYVVHAVVIKKLMMDMCMLLPKIDLIF